MLDLLAGLNGKIADLDAEIARCAREDEDCSRHRPSLRHRRELHPRQPEAKVRQRRPTGVHAGRGRTHSDSAWSQSFPWFAPAEALQREQELTSLTPKRGLIAAQPVERIGRQVREADKGACEILELINRLHDR
jgi:hypothetical protein